MCSCFGVVCSGFLLCVVVFGFSAKTATHNQKIATHNCFLLHATVSVLHTIVFVLHTTVFVLHTTVGIHNFELHFLENGRPSTSGLLRRPSSSWCLSVGWGGVGGRLRPGIPVHGE